MSGRRQIPFTDPQVAPVMKQVAQEYGELQAAQADAFNRCRRGDKQGCVSVLFLELFLRAAREARQMDRLMEALREQR